MRTLYLTAALLGFSTLGAQAEAPATLPLTYANFEAAIAHVDLENCPDALAGSDRFCRATLAHDQIHVFAFTTEGASELVGFASFEADGLPELLK